MTRFSSKAMLGAAAAVVVAALLYGFAVRPQRAENESLRRQNESLRTAVQGLENSLRTTPQVPDEERQLWPFLRQRLAATLYEEDHVMAAMASMTATARAAGAQVVSALVEKRPEPAAPAVPSVSPFPTTARGTVPGAELEAAVADRLDEEAAPPRPQPRVAQGETRQPQPPRRPLPAPERDDALDLNWPNLGRDVAKYPVKMEVAGPYPTWVELFNRMSAQVAPALVERLEALAEDGGAAMRLSLTVPVLAPGEGEAPPPESAVAVTSATRRRYFLPELAEPLAAPFPRAQSDPFGPRRPQPLADEPGERRPLPRPSAILRRNGEAVAVFGTRIVRVGDYVEGYRVIAIRDDAVYFQE